MREKEKERESCELWYYKQLVWLDESRRRFWRSPFFLNFFFLHDKLTYTGLFIVHASCTFIFWTIFYLSGDHSKRNYYGNGNNCKGSKPSTRVVNGTEVPSNMIPR